MNETTLFRNQWQFRPESGESDDAFKARIRPMLRMQLAEAKTTGVLVPQVVYGFFAVNSDGNDLIVWQDGNRSIEATRSRPAPAASSPLSASRTSSAPSSRPSWTTPRSTSSRWANPCRLRPRQLFAENRYQDYLLLHGLGVEMTEALAEMWHRRIREEWGFADEDGPTLTGLFRQQYRGGRYSWGYPACPDLEDNAKVAELLAADAIGVAVSEETSWQYHPEQTTSAIICHHPQAKYFVARA